MTDARGFVTSNSWSVTRHLLAMAFPNTPQGVPIITNTYDVRDWLASTENPFKIRRTTPMTPPTSRPRHLAGASSAI